MHRQAIIYVVAATLSGMLSLYLLHTLAYAFERFGPSVTTTIIALVAAIMLPLCGLYSWLALLFMRRAVETVHSVNGTYQLLPYRKSFSQPVNVAHVSSIRTIGEQFSSNESRPRFTIFSAGGKSWVTTVSAFSAAQASPGRNEA